jgi:hypothetical protein
VGIAAAISKPGFSQALEFLHFHLILTGKPQNKFDRKQVCHYFLID